MTESAAPTLTEVTTVAATAHANALYPPSTTTATRSATRHPRPTWPPSSPPTEYFHRHLRSIEGFSPGLIRRIASIRLVQMITGGPLGDAADFLGITTVRTRTGTRMIYSSGGIIKRARSRPDPGELDAALEEIAAEIIAAGHFINYKHRRDTLRNWAISSQDWAEMLQHSQARAGNRLAPGERERQWASVIVWAEITRGEHVFAPRPVRDQQPPEIRREWSRRSHPGSWPLNPETSKTTPSRIYLALRNTLISYAAELTTEIDGTASPTEFRLGPHRAN
jgi:hypothetical protein